jgi:hypothetical protein
MSDEYLGENQPERRTTPTWELELLISGATVFGLMQLPDPLNRTLIILMNSNEESIVFMISLINIYLQFSLITLIVTFILHLLARAYWVALVGMYSVYPHGIRWDNKNTSGGPAYREFGKNLIGNMPDQIDRADNRATKIFGLGFGLAMPMMSASLVMGLMIIIMTIVQMSNGDMEKWNKGIWIACAALVLPFFIAYFIDYLFGEKPIAKSIQGWITKIFSVYSKIGLGNGTNLVMALYTSNAGMHKTATMMGVVMTPLMIGVALFTATRGVSIDNGAYDGLPKSELGSEFVIRPEYYSNTRGVEFSTSLAPYIEDSVAQSNYLRLFIPYQPSRYNELLKKQCPETMVRKAANNGEGLDCLSAYFAIQVDAQAISLPLLAATDSKTGQRGIVVMIDIRQLSAGRHLLKIKAMPKRSENRKNEAPKFHKIPFWK